MDLERRIITRELLSPKNFSNFMETDFGYLFYDKECKSSHDSNHGVIFPSKVSNLEETLRHIANFYLEKGIQPRIYQPYVEGYFMENASIFRKNSWDVQIYGKVRFMILRGENRIKSEKRLKIREISEWDERIEKDILIPNGSLYEVEVLRKSFKNKDIKIFAGFLDERAVSLATLDYTDKEIASMNSAETAEELRGRGYARELVSEMVEYHKKNSNALLYLWPLNKTAEKIFEEAGFETAFMAEAGSAIYNKA